MLSLDVWTTSAAAALSTWFVSRDADSLPEKSRKFIYDTQHLQTIPAELNVLAIHMEEIPVPVEHERRYLGGRTLALVITDLTGRNGGIS